MTLNLLNLLLFLFIYYFFITKKFVNFLAIPSKPLALLFDFSALALCLGTTLIEIAVYNIIFEQYRLPLQSKSCLPFFILV